MTTLYLVKMKIQDIHQHDEVPQTVKIEADISLTEVDQSMKQYLRRVTVSAVLQAHNLLSSFTGE